MSKIMRAYGHTIYIITLLRAIYCVGATKTSGFKQTTPAPTPARCLRNCPECRKTLTLHSSLKKKT